MTNRAFKSHIKIFFEKIDNKEKSKLQNEP